MMRLREGQWRFSRPRLASCLLGRPRRMSELENDRDSYPHGAERCWSQGMSPSGAFACSTALACPLQRLT